MTPASDNYGVGIAVIVLVTAVICFLLGASVVHRTSRGVSPIPTLPIFNAPAQVTGGEGDEEEAKIVKPERKVL